MNYELGYMQKDFLQSEEWRKFQEAVGRRTFNVSEGGFRVNIVEHKLPIVGNYFYVPRLSRNSQLATRNLFKKLISLAKKEDAGWIRIDISDSRLLDLIRDYWRVVKAPHDMQPRQIFVIDIARPEEELLAEMKAKTRYNIRLSQKRGVAVKAISNFQFPISKQKQTTSYKLQTTNYTDEFLRLIKITSKRNKIKSHPENYYREMLKIPCVRLYAAEYQGKVIAANLMAFYGDTAIYLHGASDNEFRNVMAPFLLQWRAILDAKKAGCERYDMGGVKIQNPKSKIQNPSWAGITRFKLGFSPKTKPVEFLGSYDVVISSWRYWVYRVIQLIKSFAK